MNFVFKLEFFFKKNILFKLEFVVLFFFFGSIYIDISDYIVLFLINNKICFRIFVKEVDEKIILHFICLPSVRVDVYP